MSSAVQIYGARDIPTALARWESFVLQNHPFLVSKHPAWMCILAKSLQHEPFCLEVREGELTRGLLPLVFVRSVLFGRFLVSMPYVNYGGVISAGPAAATALVDRAVALADELRVRYLELRHDQAPIEHPALVLRDSAKVHMHLALPESADQLWHQLTAKVRNQIRKAQKSDLTLSWGRHDLLAEYYAVFSENMRDLGTPVYGQGLFRAILDQFPQQAELAVVRLGKQAVAAALLLHGWGVSEVPSASALRAFRQTNANMLMYWHLLERAHARGNRIFDFGRSSPDSNTFRFKKQWGALPLRAQWQYYLRQGNIDDLRLANPRFQHLIAAWQRLPLWLTRIIGPRIVRGIP